MCFFVKGLSDYQIHFYSRSRSRDILELSCRQEDDGDIEEPVFTGNSSLEESDFHQQGAYGRGEPPRLTYPDLYRWTTPPMRGHFNSQPNGQLTTQLESQKQLMSMFRDMGQRLSTLESSFAALQTQADSSQSSSGSPEERKRIPSQLTVSVKCISNHRHVLPGVYIMQKTISMIHDAFDEDDQFRPHLG